MRILELELQNIKSYQNAVIRFSPGVNGIVGANGSGKSTIPEAIGFALFNCPPTGRNYRRFIREGVKQGYIRVRIQSAEDERAYDVERYVGSNSRYYVTDCQEEYIVCEDAHDVQAFMQGQMGGASQWEGLDPATLFRHAVGVPQGSFQAPFLETPGHRKKRFGPVLGVEKYRHASDQLRDTANYVKDLQQEKERRKAHLEGQLQTLGDPEADLQQAESAAQQKRAALQRVSTELTQSTQTLEQWRARQQALARAQAAREQSRLAMQESEIALRSARSEVERAQAAQTQVETHAQAHTRYRAVERELQDVEEDCRQARAWQQELDLLSDEEQRIEKQRRAREQQLLHLAEIRERRAALKDEYQEALRLKERLAALDLHQAPARAQDLEEELSEWEVRLAQAQRELALAESDIEQRTQLLAQSQQAAQEAEQCSQQASATERQKAQVQTQLEALQEQLARLQRLAAEIPEREGQLAQAQRELALAESDIEQRTQLLAQSQQAAQEAERCGQQASATAHRKVQAQAQAEALQSQLVHLQQKQDTLFEEIECPICKQPLQPEQYKQITAQTQRSLADREAERNQLEAEEQAWRQQQQAHTDQSAQRQNEAAVLKQETDRQAAQFAMERAREILAAQDEELDAAYRYLPQDVRLRPLKDLSLSARVSEKGRDIAEQTRQGLTDYATQVNELEATEQDWRRQQRMHADQSAQWRDETASLKQETDRQIAQFAIERAREILDAKQKELEAAHQHRRQREHIRERLEALDPVARQYEQFSRELDREPHIQQALDDLQDRQHELRAKQSALHERMQPYVNVEEQAQDLRQELEQCRTGFAIVETQQVLAAQFPRLRAALDDLQTAGEERQRQAETDQAEFERCTQAYNPETHAQAEQDCRDLERDRDKLDWEWQTAQENREKCLQAVEQYRKLRSQLTLIETEHGDVQRRAEHLIWIRKLLQDAQPLITARLIERISQEASSFYCSLMGNYATPLSWTEDFGIEIRAGNNVRVFSQLSGGEQMAASLAVIMALLHYLTKVHFVFLDEPTVNMDEERRMGFAQRLRAIKGFEQLFVISHDDSFEESIDHLIRIRKNEEGSYLVVG